MITPLGWLERVPTYKDQIAADREQGPRDLRLPRLPGAADGGHRPSTAPTSCRWGRTRRATSRSAARSCAGSTASTARSSRSRKALFTPTPKVPGIDGRKMSKSYGNAINLTDPPDVDPPEVHGDVHRPARIKRSDPGPSRGLQPLRVPRAALAAGASQERVDARVPGRGDRLRRRQEAARRADHRLPRADPRAARRSCCATAARCCDILARGLAAGARAGGARRWTWCARHGARLPQAAQTACSRERRRARREAAEAAPQPPAGGCCRSPGASTCRCSRDRSTCCST